MRNSLVILGIFAVLVSCGATGGDTPANSGQGKRIDGVDAITRDGLLMQNVSEVSNDVTKSDLPVMRAIGVGNPKYEIMADGSYIASYRYGQDRYFKIVATRRSLTEKPYPPHGTMKVMDLEIPSYGTGNEDPEYTSQHRHLFSPDRNWANFIFIHGGNRDSNSGKEIESDLPKVSW